ncbi:DUF2214 family protein [Undibacterium curvum]|uniref:DUF2214 family protein n=1 Tax=Undibacterium curvum TaxID=2762294 RepID=A0ABR6ZZY1_9BURK|nr:DUF2214 family protein [Undibacterium curvum]MBC3930226.1 DUF2214 family protein [Undibacterium curvum]
MSILVAFLHHLAAFTLVSALLAEAVFIAQPITMSSARSLRFLDALYGMSATLILVIGVLRVMYFEKGADYYLHSHAFLFKMAVFAVVGLISIYPTVVFLRWGKTIKQNRIPALSGTELKNIRRVIRLELCGIVLIILNAVLMAKGTGFSG